MAAKSFDKQKSVKISIDDTTPLICVVESGEKIHDHVKYFVKVWRGITSDMCWQLSKRYKDFDSLDADLRISNIPLPLPPKKLLGNFDREFVAERAVGLQNYMSALLKQSMLASSLPVKRFLDPDNYSVNFTEVALQHVSMVLRSEKKWDVVEPLPDIGWRIRKEYILVKAVDEQKSGSRYMLSWVEFGPDRYLPDKELSALMGNLQNIKHPHIIKPLLSTSNENGGFVIRPYFEKGTLKDLLCKCKPNGHFLKKYAAPSKVTCLDIQTIKLFGKQILETLSLLHEKGMPYGHLHTGNIVIDSNANMCKLLDVENWLLGLPSYHRQHVLQFKKIQTTEMIDVYCFGHVLYEMTFGKELLAESCDDYPPQCPAQLRSVLESILTTEACKNGLPTVKNLLAHSFFSDVTMLPGEKPFLKIPSKLKEPLKQAKEEFERRLQEEQKMIYKKKRVSKAKQYHMSEDVKKQRKQSKKKALENGDVGKNEQSTIDCPSTLPPLQQTQITAPPPPPLPPSTTPGSVSSPVPAAPAPPILPVGIPPAPPASAPPRASSDRGALLSSITGFKKGGLKKAVTVDKSVPKV